MLPLTPGSHSARRELNPRLALIRSRLWPLSYGPSSRNRAGGSRTHTLPIKNRIRCHYATAPKVESDVRVSTDIDEPCSSPRPHKIVRGGIAPATGDVSDRHASFTP